MLCLEGGSIEATTEGELPCSRRTLFETPSVSPGQSSLCCANSSAPFHFSVAEASMRSVLLSGLLVTLIGGCATHRSLSPLAPLERSLVYYPRPYPEGDWDPSYLPKEDAWFTAEDGTKLHGWYVPHPNPRAVALFMHGNAGNIANRAPGLAVLHYRHNVAVMAFDYRGYGRSEGTPSERGILMDARAALKWLQERTHHSPQDMVFMGRSLGGAVAVDLAAEHHPRGLVLASTFTSLPDVGKHFTPILPTRLMMTQRLNSQAKIGRYKGPLLMSHGNADSVVPYELGVRLFEAAPGRKQFITIEGGDHNDPQSEEYRLAFDAFIASLPRRPAPSNPTRERPANFDRVPSSLDVSAGNP